MPFRFAQSMGKRRSHLNAALAIQSPRNKFVYGIISVIRH
ncbi:hypothetical protein VCRA2128O305_190005 [Vibrio crassostreae]|nr:hypothetical protein VCRA2116O234_130038 [Vibrio crassostreae]CAK1770275.1 hypothetical protein VCRA2110O181_150023 [Vibrio crassostreae]CAK1778487.1 hypothetical protein VCRA2113O204_150097 [Vibrio crassostreae]CAK1784086.1 hypothetical protein VCRA2113O220_160023 [Vibrio crassostreae]CAK1794787.1 hypothetical protein VCRA2113O198_160098 [Vibrio crassostreae]